MARAGTQVATVGLTDSHYHLRGVGERELTLNLAGSASLEELLERLRGYAEAHPEYPWITGRGWIETHWQPPAFPARADLDRAVPDRPVYLVRADDWPDVEALRELYAEGAMPVRNYVALRWRSLIDAGAIVIGGSDAPLEVGDPRIEFHAATTRTDLGGGAGAGWHPEQAVSEEEAVRMFTSWPAWAAFEE